jgi:ATP-dependent DNA helicase DinG
VSRAAELLGPSGPFARQLGEYEARDGQLEMARAVERSLATDRILLCEAGTGTGKTLAYLVPALLSGRKVVISTATRALQEQIFFKDLPLVATALGVEPRAALMKGLSNYLCLRRYHQFRGSAEAARPSVGHKLAMVESFVRETETGDLAELSALGEDDPVLSMVASSSDTRVGVGCQYHGDCYVTRMKRDAEAARLVVVNHHLFFADLALRGPHPGRVLPDYDAVVFDEAHQLEDIATAFFSVRVSQARLTHLLQEVERCALAATARNPGASADAGRLGASTRDAGNRFFEALSRRVARDEGRAVVEHDFWTGTTEETYHQLDTALEGLAGLAESLGGRIGGSAGPGVREALALRDALAVAGRRAQSLRDDLAMIVDGAPGRITWVEQGRTVSLSSSPVDVSTTFRERIFESIPSVVLTSATLASGAKEATRPFDYVQARLGLHGDDAPDAETLLVPSPFDYEANALLYLPDDLPDPAASDYVQCATLRTVELLEMTDGGAFVLSTSIRAMRELFRGLSDRVTGRRLYLQGDAPKASLLSAFKADKRGVLVATMSFWQGVDVPGEALRLVVIDKLPFPVPSDPIVKARGEAIEAAGGNGFTDLSIPVAKIALKQGFGRLIRTRADHGVVALLDSRVHRKGYGRRVLDGLPPAARTRDLEDVRAFWRDRGDRAPGANR